MPVPIRFMKMSLILLKRFLLQAPFLGSPSHNKLSLFWIPIMLPFLSRVPSLPLPYVSDIPAISSPPDEELFGLMMQTSHVPRNIKKYLPPLYILHPAKTASCLAKTNTVHEDLRHLLTKILIVHGRINTYVSTKILTGHFIHIKHFIAEWKFPFLFYVF